jgi:membrane protease YdiL (CAAX protease family)
MTIKRLILVVVTMLAIFNIGFSLWQSWSQPQIQSRLELYQTNLVLQAAERQTSSEVVPAQKTLLGNDPTRSAMEAYQELRQSAETSLARLKGSPRQVTEEGETSSQAIAKLQYLLTELDLRLGLLQVKQKEINQAQSTWQTLIQQIATNPNLGALGTTAGILSGLWSDPPQIYPNAEPQIKQNLDGWFRYYALAKLYQLQQRPDALASLQIEEQEAAERAFNNLAIVGGVPVISGLIGAGILLFLVGQWLVRQKQALLAPDTMTPWTTPWNGEVVWEVMILGFFLVGQIASQLVMPIAILSLQPFFSSDPTVLSDRAKAAYSLLQYLLIAAGGLGVLWFAIRSFFPLPQEWFPIKVKFSSLGWGLAGYLAALPLVIVVSLVNQKIWQGQGGSNPILPIVLGNRDGIALLLFFFTATIAAPLFEEILFRGFLLSSLTRYFPMWGAIALSSLIFAIAHLSLSEVLPLATLGMVLGFVYVRSRNLFSSMFLHGLWNSGTLLSLFILGSGQN